MPVALDGERLGLVELLERAAEIGCRHGVGIVDHIEDRIVGLKVRDIYEVPAAAIILPAHAELERLVGTIHQNQFKAELDRKWAYLVYAGLWWEPLRADLDAYMEAVNAQVTGTIGMKLYKGTARVVTRESPNAVYDAALATFETERRPVQPAGLARVHRAVVAAVAHGPPLAHARRGVRRRRCSTRRSDSPVWKGARFYVRAQQAPLAQAAGGRRAGARRGDARRRRRQAQRRLSRPRGR